MSSNWIKLLTGYKRHPKTLRLRKELGPGAQWYPVSLWLYCADHCLSGEVGDDLIEEACEWTGKSGRLLTALKAHGFVDEGGKVHDWREWSGADLQRIDERRRADRVRKSGGKSAEPPQKLQRNSDGIPAELRSPSGGIPDPRAPARRGDGDGAGEKSNPLPPDGGDDAVQRVFDHYRQAFRKGSVYSLTPARRKKIAARLDEIGEPDVLKAIDAAAADKWFRGTCKHNGVEDVLKSRETAETWASHATDREPDDDPGFMGEDIDDPAGEVDDA